MVGSFRTTLHKASLVALPVLLVAGTMPTETLAQDHDAIARRVLSTVPLIDGHNDLPWAIRNAEVPRDVAAYGLRGTTAGHTDIPRLREGMLGGQFWSVYVPYDAVEEGAAKVQLEQIDIAKRIFEMYPDVFQEAYTAADVENAFGAGRIASMMGMEGGHAIENSLGALRAFFDAGVRYMTLTHGSTIDWADSATDDPRHDGLTRFGEEVVREMNRMGMIVDLSHTAPTTMHDALDVTEAPVIFSHSSAKGVTDHPRNVSDDVLRRLPENGGVVMITYVGSFVSADGPATLSDVADHIDHVRRVAGVEHVGIGADYDGTSSLPAGLEDVSTYPVILAEMSRRGWTEQELGMLAGGNVLRVMREVEATARVLRRQRGPSTATIEELDGGM